MQTEGICVWISRILISNRMIQKPLATVSLSLFRYQKRSCFKLLIWQESIWIQLFDECLPPSLEWNLDSDISKICWIESFWGLFEFWSDVWHGDPYSEFVLCIYPFTVVNTHPERCLFTWLSQFHVFWDVSTVNHEMKLWPSSLPRSCQTMCTSHDQKM